MCVLWTCFYWWVCRAARFVAGTLLGLRTELKAAIEKLTGSDRDGLVTAIKSGCELFLRFITLCKLEDRVCLQYCSLAMLNIYCCLVTTAVAFVFCQLVYFFLEFSSGYAGSAKEDLWGLLKGGIFTDWVLVLSPNQRTIRIVVWGLVNCNTLIQLVFEIKSHGLGQNQLRSRLIPIWINWITFWTTFEATVHPYGGLVWHCWLVDGKGPGL